MEDLKTKIEKAKDNVYNLDALEDAQHLIEIDLFPPRMDVRVIDYSNAVSFVYESRYGELDLTVMGDKTLYGDIKFDEKVNWINISDIGVIGCCDDVKTLIRKLHRSEMTPLQAKVENSLDEHNDKYLEEVTRKMFDMELFPPDMDVHIIHVDADLSFLYYSPKGEFELCLCDNLIWGGIQLKGEEEVEVDINIHDEIKEEDILPIKELIYKIHNSEVEE